MAQSVSQSMVIGAWDKLQRMARARRTSLKIFLL